MKILNKTLNGLCHTAGKDTYFLKPGEFKEIPQEVADIWLKIDGVIPYVEPEDIAKAEAEAKAKAEAEKKALEEENEKLKKELEALKKSEKAETKAKSETKGKTK